MTEAKAQRLKWVACAVLGAAVLAAFWPALCCSFVNYDDPLYVTENWHVRHGLNGVGLRWAFTAVTASNWHPLTWVSHMLDCQIYDLQPAGHHLTSLLLHIANSVLLFLLLNRLTGALGRSGLVAAMFALHPLRVESVAWISERKDVLSSFFWLLSVGAYVRYVQEIKVQGSKFKVYYALALVLFACALISKPMVVTLPFVLWLLDYWPLGRWQFTPKFSWQPVLEKIPFLALSVASCFVTFLVQHRAGTVATLDRFPLSIRLANVCVAYARYLSKNFWPVDLVTFYPYVAWRGWQIFGAVMLLAGMTALALLRARTSPYLLVGWLWFLGMLVPVIGLVQTGGQAMADRFSYLPGIGLGIMTVWGLCDLVATAPRIRMILSTVAGLAAVLFAILTWRHTGDYHDSRSLWEADLRVYPHCLVAHNNFSRWLTEQGQWDEALDHSRQALAILSDDPTAHNDLSRIFLHEGKPDEAIAEGLKSVQLQPRSEVNRQTLARAYLQKGDFAAAAASLREAIKIEPTASDAWCNLGYALLQQGQIPEAAAAYEKSLELNPDYALAHNDLGNICLRQGRLDQAMEHFQRAVELAPTLAEAHYNLAGILARRGRLDEAIAHSQKAVEIRPELAAARQQLAALKAARDGNSGR
jgi:tetratricopeptide (TPR) repeat protein